MKSFLLNTVKVVFKIIISIFFPGLIQLYRGIHSKGFILITLYVFIFTIPMILILGLLPFVIWIYSIVDSLKRGDYVYSNRNLLIGVFIYILIYIYIINNWGTNYNIIHS